MQNDNNAPVDAQAENTQEQAGSSAATAGYTATREGEGVEVLYALPIVEPINVEAYRAARLAVRQEMLESLRA